MAKLSLLLLIVLSTVLPLAGTGQADSPQIGKKTVLSQNVEVTITNIETKSNGDKIYTYTAAIDSAPRYMPDLVTPINCKWYAGLLPNEYVTSNLFTASVKGESVSLYYDSDYDYANIEFAKWSPVLTVGGIVYPAGKATILPIDPVNSYYQSNTLEWDYGICKRHLRIIEGMLIENWIFDKDPQADVSITQNIDKSKGFTWETQAYAYDSASNGIAIESSGDTKTVKAQSFKGASYPVIIDPTDTFVTSSSDGYLENIGVNYLNVRNSDTGTVGDTAIYCIEGQQWSGSQYKVERSMLYFDTSSIPNEATFTSANLSIYVYWDGTTVDFNLTIQSGQPTYPHDPMVTTDFNQTWYNSSGSGGSKNTTTFNFSGYNNISFNATGLTFINSSDTTKLCLRSSREIIALAPATTENFNFYTYEKGAGYRPTLYATYVVLAPDIQTNPATYVSITSARMNGLVVDDKSDPPDVYFNLCYCNGTFLANYSAGTNVTESSPFYYDLINLLPATCYNFSAFGVNLGGTTYGSWLEFTTVAATAYNITNLHANPSPCVVNLSWQKAQNFHDTVIRYSVAGCPANNSSGTEIYNGSGSFFSHTGLETGTTYYYVFWGYEGGYWGNQSDCLITTTPAGSCADHIPLNSSIGSHNWFVMTDSSKMDWFFLTPMVNGILDDVGMPHDSGWMLIFVFLLVVSAFIWYLASHNLIWCCIWVIICISGLGYFALLPLWFDVIFGIAALAVALKGASE